MHIDPNHVVGVYDRKRAIHDMAKNEEVDVITGDWMSEANMTLRGSDKREKLGSGTLVGKAYEPYFLEELDPAIPWLAKRGVKIAVNAGASDVQGLAEAVKGLVKNHGVDLKVAYVDGDDVTDAVLELYKKGKIRNFQMQSTPADHSAYRRKVPQPPSKQEHPRLGIRASLCTVLPRRYRYRCLF